MRIFYYIPFHDKPSWGIGIVLSHIQILLNNGFKVYGIVKAKKFKLDWIEINIPTISRVEFHNLKLDSEDVLVVPEVSVGMDNLKKLNCTKILFIQNVGYIYDSLPPKESHKTLGFSHVISIMPHMSPIISKFIGLPEFMIPPFVSEKFFNDTKSIKRKKRIVMFPKFDQPDYNVVKGLVSSKLGEQKEGIFKPKGWELLELKGYSHDKVAEILKKSEIFIALNTFESMNASVVEAMAAGCLVFTYEGYGSRDYLEDRQNGFVFQNNEPYQLTEKLFETMDNYDSVQNQLTEIRRLALKTAHFYNRRNMEAKLLEFFNQTFS